MSMKDTGLSTLVLSMWSSSSLSLALPSRCRGSRGFSLLILWAELLRSSPRHPEARRRSAATHSRRVRNTTAYDLLLFLFLVSFERERQRERERERTREKERERERKRERKKREKRERLF